MPVTDIDFGNGTPQGGTPNGNNGNVTDLNGGGTPDITGQDGSNGGTNPNNNNVDLGNGGNSPANNGDNNGGTNQNNGGTDNNGNNGGTGDNGGNSDGSSTGELHEGDTVTLDDAVYTVDKDGNLVDDKGNIFKKSNEVKDFLAAYTVSDGDVEDKEMSIENIQKLIGQDIVDDEGKPVEFANDAQGVKAYLDAVMDLKSQEIQAGAINKLLDENPLLTDFINYVNVNGTAKGFGEMQDRSGIEINKEDEVQQVAIIKQAAKEFGNKLLDDNYIKYLKDNGKLYTVAKEQLAALVEKDNNVRKDYAARAEAARQAELQRVEEYWNKVSSTIDKRVICGYRIPESYVKEIDGKKYTLTPNDFYNYIAKPTERDEEGNQITKYRSDLNKISEEEALQRNMLDAWLMFTGGSYKDLINMAVNENNVRNLKLQANQQRTTRSIKLEPKSNKKGDVNSVLLS